MPKGGKKSIKKSNCTIGPDVKLSDFADSSAPAGGRLRKSAGSSLSKEVEDIRNIEETLWFEREIEEFDLLNVSTENRKKIEGKVDQHSFQNTKINQYPIDVWYLIGQHIQPEDVRLFASICKDSYQVSRSYTFWMGMYKRYYKPSVPLPARLQPDGIDQAFSLKSCVVRSLFHMYPGFNGRTRSSVDVCCLSNLCCTLMWRIQENGKWVFHFKFKTTGACLTPDVTAQAALHDLWTSRDTGKNQDRYVNHNPDEGKILRFSCAHFVVVPPKVMGSRLRDVRINLAHDMRRQKLQLTFSPSHYFQIGKGPGVIRDGYCDVVEFDAVENLVILNWWHPQYPFSYT